MGESATRAGAGQPVAGTELTLYKMPQTVIAMKRAICPLWIVGLCLWGALWGCQPQAEPPVMSAPAVRPPEDAIRIAGASAATPLMRHLVRRFAAASPGRPIVVEAPLGNQGALQALEAGVVDAALVALPAGRSRPPGGIEVATTPIGVIASSGVPSRTMSPSELASILRDEAGNWPGGHRRRVLLRPEFDPAQRLIGELDVDLGAALEEAHRRHTWPVYHEDEAWRDALKRAEGAIAIADLGSVHQLALPVRTIKSTESETWGELVLWLIPRRQAQRRLYGLMDFIKSPEARAMVIEMGYGRR